MWCHTSDVVLHAVVSASPMHHRGRHYPRPETVQTVNVNIETHPTKNALPTAAEFNQRLPNASSAPRCSSLPGSYQLACEPSSVTKPKKRTHHDCMDGAPRCHGMLSIVLSACPGTALSFFLRHGASIAMAADCQITARAGVRSVTSPVCQSTPCFRLPRTREPGRETCRSPRGRPPWQGMVQGSKGGQCSCYLGRTNSSNVQVLELYTKINFLSFDHIVWPSAREGDTGVGRF